MKIFENYKNRQCKTWLGKYFQRLTFTWIYKLYTAIGLVLVGAIALNFTQEGSFIENFVSGLYSLGFICIILMTLTFIAYAFIINPFNFLKDKFKNKK